MIDLRKLAQLGDLTEAAFLSEQAKLAKLARQESELRAQLARLRQDRSDASGADRPSGDPALAAGADVRWHQWIAARQTRLNAELLQVMTLKRYQIEKVRRAHGRSQALDHLVQRTKAEATRARAARQDRDT